MNLCPNVTSRAWKNLVNKIGEREAWREFFKFGYIPNASKYTSVEGTVMLQSIRTRSTEDIAEGINKENIRSQDELKYTNHIVSLVIGEFGEITPNQVAQVSMDKAFDNTKNRFLKALKGMNDFLEIVQSPEAFDGIKAEDETAFNNLIETFSLQGATSFDDVIKTRDRYQSIINKFEKYKEFSKADLVKKGIKEVNGKVQNVDPQDAANQEEDDTESLELSTEEIGERFGKDSNEMNPLLSASLKVKALVNAVPIPGAYELGIPLYADPIDVFADLLDAGVNMELSGYTETKSKYEAFISSLQEIAQGRPYLYNVINKLETFKKKGEWDTVNQVLTFVTKAFANETLVLYKVTRNGSDVLGIKESKTISLNRDTIEEQVLKDWYNNLLQSKFFIKTATGERYADPAKVELLGKIIEEGKALGGEEQVQKFRDFFKVLGITLTQKDMEYISPKFGNELKKNKAFNFAFSQNGFLERIYKDGYLKNVNVPFDGSYGLQNEKTNMRKLARLYYEANPGKYKVPSSKTADGKQKYLHMQPSFVEIKKREWEKGNTTRVTNSALARPNKEFWLDVRNNQKTFALNYFNGMREQEAGKDGKVRKNFTDNEQLRTMFMKHQENMATGTYIIFTLSDKTSSIEAKMTKEFFVDSKELPVGKGQDFSLKNGKIEYTDSFKEKVYDNFVAPEVSRILSAIAAGNTINIENFDISSKLFYIIPIINSNQFLENFRKDLYSGKKSAEELKAMYGNMVGNIVTQELIKSTEEKLDEYITKGIIKVTKGIYTFPSFRNGFKPGDYVNRFRATQATGRNLALLMLMDMETNYMNAQVKTIQFLRFDPAAAFKKFKGFKKPGSFYEISGKDKVRLAKATWDEFSKRAAALIAPGSQGSWSWDTKLEKTGKYFSSSYRAITANDYNVVVNKKESETTDAQEFVTVQEYIDTLMNEGRIPLVIWESITSKIKEAGPGGFYKLTDDELKYTYSPTKPVYVHDAQVGEAEDGLNRIDYVKSSRYPLVPEHEAGSERDKLRQWMEKNDIRSLNFVSAKKLGRPTEAVTVFDKNGNFVEPTKDATEGSVQLLSREGLRNQQEIPHQKQEIATVSQMNRTLLDGLLGETFNFGALGDLKGSEMKSIKEQVRSRLFELKSQELQEEMGDLSQSHVGLYNLLKKTILEDTTGSYGENDLRMIELDEKGFFKFPLELNFKFQKLQGLINSMVNKNVMLKMNGTSFIQVSGVGAKYNFSSLSEGIKSGIIWVDSYAKNFKKGEQATLSYIKKEDGVVKPAQVIVSQYIRDSKGNLINLDDFVTEKDGMKILDTSKIDPSILQLVSSRIPNQSLPSTLPIEVVGFLPSYMENVIVIPDGVTGQMGSDFDVDKLFAYLSKVYAKKSEDGKYTEIRKQNYKFSSISDIQDMKEDELKELYKDLHWTVLTHPAAYDAITKSIDMPEVGSKVESRRKQLEEYEIGLDEKANLPLGFNTSIERFNDNRSGKSGVSIYASLISAHADFQDKILRLTTKDEEGNPVADPLKIKLSKGEKAPVVDLLYVGKLGKSKSFLDKTRSISDNLNIMFTEAVDNAKNQNLKEFNWTEKSMSAVGAFQMLTSEDGKTPPIEFSMDLTSQASIISLFDLIDQKRDSFGEFDPNAFQNSVNIILEDLIKQIDSSNLLKTGETAVKYLTDSKRDNVLDPQTLSEMWLVGKILEDGSSIIDAAKYEQQANDLTNKAEDVEVYDPITNSYTKETKDSKGLFEDSVIMPKLAKAAKEFGYKNVNDLLLKYYTTQYDSVELFSRLDTIGRELMTIIGAIYPYTKGIGPTVVTTKQKLNQLNKLSSSPVFSGVDRIAGEVFKNEFSGRIGIVEPVGEIGTAIEKSYITAQDIYSNLFPIISGKKLEDLLQNLLDDIGLDKESLGKQSFISKYEDVFNAVKAFMFTHPELELFDNARATRASLLIGENSLGAVITKLKEFPEYSTNGFLKNIDVKKEYDSEVYTISFKAPLGQELDEKNIFAGFYQLATSENELVRETARNLAIYPFVTGDAGMIGRFIPFDYYMGDSDFRKTIQSLYDIYSAYLGDTEMGLLKDQIVQNNPEVYAKKFNFSTAQADNTFKRNFRKIINNADSLANVKSFKIKLGDFEADEKASGVMKALQVKLSRKERNLATELEVFTDTKYPPYMLITDSVISDIPEAERNIKYLYKRTSPAVTKDGIATYERINILGFRSIKEYSFNEPNLKSAIPGNQVDISDEEFKDISADNAAPEIVETKPAKVVVPGVVNIPDSGLTVEKANEFIDLLQPQIASQAYVENKARTANMMFSFGLRWAKNIPNATEKSEQGANLGQPRPDRKNIKSKEGMTYGYYLTDQNNNPLPSIDELQPIMDFIQSKLGIDMSNYDAMLGNIYDEKSFISQHRDTTESVTAEGYPVIVLNLGADGHLEYDKDLKSTYASYKKSGQLNLTNGGIYAFGVDGENRFTFHHRIGSGLESANPLKPITLPNGQTLTDYRITLTFRRASDLEAGMPEKPAKIVTQPPIVETSIEPSTGVEISKVNYTKETPNDKSKGFFFTENLQAYLANRGRGSEVEFDLAPSNVKLDVTANNNQAGIRQNNGVRNINAFAIISKKYQQNGSGSFVKEEGQFKDTDSDFELFKKYNSEAINEALAYGKPLVISGAGIATGKSALPLRFAEWLNNELKTKLGIQGEIKENTSQGYKGYGIFNLSIAGKTGNNPADYTNHSGGAKLADTEWDQIGREYGVTDHRHYREPLEYTDTKGEVQKGSETLDSQRLRDKGIKPTHITQQEYNEGARKATAAFRMMYKDSENKSVRQAYIIRNWLQVKNADAVFALGTIKQPGENASDKAGETRVAAIPIVKGGTGYAVQMAINEGKPVYVFDGAKEGWYKYDYSVKNFVKTDTPTLTKNFAGIGSRTLSSQEVIDKSLQAIRDVYENTFKNNQTSATEEDESPTTNIVGYGAHTFILEGSEEEGFKMWYQKDGDKGKPVNDPGVVNKVLTAYKMQAHPENVVTLNTPSKPKYFVDFNGDVISLQETSFGKVIESADVLKRVHEQLQDSLQFDNEVKDITKETLEKGIDPKTGKRINVPVGSSDTNLPIGEDETTIYLMNDGQQRAYNFIKSKVESLLESSPYITTENIRSALTDTQAFLDPLSQKFNGLIPKVMWDNMIGLAGRGGVGKTTVIKAIMAAIQGQNKYSPPSVMYLAPSHTAATVLQESLGLDSEKANDGKVNTIQSHVRRNKQVPGTFNLELASKEDYIESWQWKAKVTDPDIIIIDESSMIGSEDIKDFLKRMATDVAENGVARMPVFVFMGDYRQLGPIGEKQNDLVNKGIISSTLFMDTEKTVELTQVMRSGDVQLHEIFDSVGKQIIKNIDLTRANQQPVVPSFDDYDRLTTRSTENMLVVTNPVGVIDDYTTYLKENNNPYGMFWVHYNQVDNANTINLASKIRSIYFQKTGYTMDDEDLEYRNFSKGDYVEYSSGIERPTSKVIYKPSSPEIKKLLDDRKTPMKEEGYVIGIGNIKPRARFKVLDIQSSQVPLSTILPKTIAHYVNDNIKIQVENSLLYNRQNKIRAYTQYVGLNINLGSYNKISKTQEGITISNKYTGEVYAKFDLHYSIYNQVKKRLKEMNDEKTAPFKPSYVGSSHTAQGNSIKNVIVGEYNIKQNGANPTINKDDIFSSLYVSLTRTSGRLIIIKPTGFPIANNQSVFQGAITDNNEAKKFTTSQNPSSIIPNIPIDADVQIVTQGGNEKINPLEAIFRAETQYNAAGVIGELFKGEKNLTDYKGFMNRLIKQTMLTPFNKSLLDVISKMKVLTPFTIVVDEQMKHPGSYDMATKTIRINPKEIIADKTLDVKETAQAIHEVVMHELIHHLTSDLLNAAPENLTQEQAKFVKNLKDLFTSVQSRLLDDPTHREPMLKALERLSSDEMLSSADKSMYYGLSNVHDFVSMLMTDSTFQDFMNNMAYEGEKSMFTKFLDILVNFIFEQMGIVRKDSVLEQGLKNTIALINSRGEAIQAKTEVLNSVRTAEAAKEVITKNLTDMVKFLNIKTTC